jgi:alpha-L-fucosidase
MDLFEKSGIRVFAITTKHHEGFSLFDTKTRVKKRVDWTAKGGPRIVDTDMAYSVMDTPSKRDIIKELTDAAHRHGIKIDLYFSHPDWFDADFRPYGFHPLITWDAILHPGKYAYQLSWDKIPFWTIMPSPSREETMRAMKRHRDQLIELLSNYGKIDMVCLDMTMGPEVCPYMKDTIKILRKIQPDVMFRARGIGNYGDYYTPEGFVPGAPENTNMPWMVIYPLGRSFSYEPEAKFHKGTRWIITNLIDSAAKGGSFMVGIGPDKNGKFHPEAKKELLETGQWLKVNGEGIYATRMWQSWNEGDKVRFTRSKDGKTVYAFSLEWPGTEFKSKLVKPAPGSQIYMLGINEPLRWNTKNGVLVIEIPNKISKNKPCQHAWAFKMSL